MPAPAQLGWDLVPVPGVLYCSRADRGCGRQAGGYARVDTLLVGSFFREGYLPFRVYFAGRRTIPARTGFSSTVLIQGLTKPHVRHIIVQSVRRLEH